MSSTGKVLRTSLLILLCFWFLSASSYATIIVPSYGETGWQTFVHTQTDESFSGTIRIGVSNFIDYLLSSVLLIDNFVLNGQAFNDFEDGTFGSFTLYGTGSIVTEAYSYNGTQYTPTHGNYMAWLRAEGADTSQYGGTDGAFVEFPLSLNVGDTVSFDWAFLAMDYSPFADFAFIAVHGQEIELIKLAQINPVPVPGTLILIGSGLLGIGGLRRKIFKS